MRSRSRIRLARRRPSEIRVPPLKSPRHGLAGKRAPPAPPDRVSPSGSPSGTSPSGPGSVSSSPTGRKSRSYRRSSAEGVPGGSAS